MLGNLLSFVAWWWLISFKFTLFESYGSIVVMFLSRLIPNARKNKQKYETKFPNNNFPRQITIWRFNSFHFYNLLTLLCFFLPKTFHDAKSHQTPLKHRPEMWKHFFEVSFIHWSVANVYAPITTKKQHQRQAEAKVRFRAQRLVTEKGRKKVLIFDDSQLWPFSLCLFIFVIITHINRSILEPRNNIFLTDETETPSNLFVTFNY